MKLGALQQLTQKVPALQGDALQQWMRSQLEDMGIDPNNLYQELEMTSRYVDTHRDISFSGEHMQLHSHTFYELLYCCTSCGAEYLVGSQRYRLQEGDIIFVPPGISHRAMLPEPMTIPYERYVLWLSGEFAELFAKILGGAFSEKQNRSGMLRADAATRKQLGDLFRAGVLESQMQGKHTEAAVVGNTIQLLVQIKRAADAQPNMAITAEKPELLDQVASYIEQYYASNITIGDLSRHFFVSNSTISHLFRQKLGVSVYRYLTQRRLIAAKSLIEKGLLLEDVATLVGFSDYSGFYRAFKQEFGISPRQYRNLQDGE